MFIFRRASTACETLTPSLTFHSSITSCNDFWPWQKIKRNCSLDVPLDRVVRRSLLTDLKLILFNFTTADNSFVLARITLQITQLCRAEHISTAGTAVVTQIVEKLRVLAEKNIISIKKESLLQSRCGRSLSLLQSRCLMATWRHSPGRPVQPRNWRWKTSKPSS